MATGSHWGPPAPNIQQNLGNRRGRLVRPGLCLPPALNGSGHPRAPRYCALTPQQPARPQRLPPAGAVLASRGPSRWARRHCSARAPPGKSRPKGLKAQLTPKGRFLLSVGDRQARPATQRETCKEPPREKTP